MFCFPPGLRLYLGSGRLFCFVTPGLLEIHLSLQGLYIVLTELRPLAQMLELVDGICKGGNDYDMTRIIAFLHHRVH